MKRMMMTLILAGALSMTALNAPAQADSTDATLGTVIGAVSGGLLGSTIGKGDGRIVATAAGTVIGAVIGRNVATSDDWERRPSKKRWDHDEGYDDDDYEDRYERVRYIKVKERHPRYKKWKRVARVDDDLLQCHEPSGRCHWVD